jgi:hypothetical protein
MCALSVDFEKWRSFCCSGVHSTSGGSPWWDPKWKQTWFVVPPIPVTCRNSDSMRLARYAHKLLAHFSSIVILMLLCLLVFVFRFFVFWGLWFVGFVVLDCDFWDIDFSLFFLSVRVFVWFFLWLPPLSEEF